MHRRVTGRANVSIGLTRNAAGHISGLRRKDWELQVSRQATIAISRMVSLRAVRRSIRSVRTS